MSCIPGYSINNNGICQINEATAYYFQGQCISCQAGYTLINQKCVYTPVTNPSSTHYLQAKNPLCISWNNGTCVDCFPGTYQSPRKICELIDPFCAIFDYVLSACNTC